MTDPKRLSCAWTSGCYSHKAMQTKSPTITDRMEVYISLVLIVFAVITAFPYAEKMMTTSLWNDELYTISNFSSAGLVRTLTDYHAPNNHIFFNALNALTPGGGVYHPAKARMWPLFSFVAMCIVLCGFLWWRKHYFESAVMAQVAMANHDLIDCALQARGYGFLLFFAAVSTVLTVRFLQSRNERTFAWLGFCTALGTWTIPVYGFFGGLLMLILYFREPNRKILYIGVFTIAIITLFHLPVMKQLFDNMSSYRSEWGSLYANFDAVVQTFAAYMPPFFRPMTTSSTMFLLFGPLAILAWDTSRGGLQDAALALVLAVVGFLAACLTLGTTPVRTTSFVVLPLACAWVFLLGDYWRRLARNGVKLLLLSAVCALFLGMDYTILSGFKFSPIENWMGAGQAIERIFPKTAHVYCNQTPQYLKVYLAPDRRLDNAFDKARFVEGTQIFGDNDFASDKRFNSQQVSPTGADILLPQRKWRGEYFIVSYSAPKDKFVDKVLVNGGQAYEKGALPDQGIKIGGQGADHMTIELQKGIVYRSVCLLFEGNYPHRVKLRVNAISSDAMRQLADTDIYAGRNSVAIALHDTETRAVEVAFPNTTGASLRIKDIWAYPQAGAYTHPKK